MKDQGLQLSLVSDDSLIDDGLVEAFSLFCDFSLPAKR